MIAVSEDMFAAAAAAEPKEVTLYDWQHEAVEQLRENIRRGIVNQILAAPTGSGKTRIATYLMQECYQKGRRGIFIADRIPLIDQTSVMFDDFGLPHGVIQADHWRWQPYQSIQVASAQTLERRQWPDNLDLIIIDEAHGMIRSLLRRIAPREIITIGLTATPFAKGLGKHYDGVVTVRTTNQLIEEGLLAPYRVFAASEPDMSGAKVVAGEWTEEETEKRALPIVGDIVTEYLKHGAGKRFIAFGVNVAHCEEIQRQMMAAGVMCGVYSYRTTDDERKEMLKDLADPNGYLQGLVSVSALAKGFDNPAIEVVIVARPLRTSFAEHIQILGRGLRRDPENPEKVCTILDHSGNCVRFWAQMHDFFENGAPPLDMGVKKEKKKQEKREREPMKCPKCASVHDPRPMCPACGHEYPRRSQVEHVAGSLSELTGLPAGSADDRQAVYSGLLYIAAERNYNPKWADHQYRARYGEWPNSLARTTAPPSTKLRNWVRSRMIAWAKAKEAAA